jgi:predicted Fe-Mo cluster-binding NifX family protein
VIEEHRILAEFQVDLGGAPASRRALLLAGLGVQVLVCGALSAPLQQAMAARGIDVCPFIAGSRDRIVRAWLAGTLGGDAYRMPGCGRRVRARRRGCRRPSAFGTTLPGEGSPGIKKGD